MPYITQEQRSRLNRPGEHPENTGELNYTIAQIVDGYLEHQGQSYQVWSDIAGTLQLLLLELQRRFIGSYEYRKCMENGDAFAVDRWWNR